MQTQSLAPNVQKESLELSLEKALIVKDVLFLSPGIWNGDEYTEEIIRNVFENTDWNELRHSHLYLDHKDTQEKSGVGAWAGFVRNPRLNELGELRGDLEIWHPMAAIWTKAHPKFGISATITAPDGETPTSFESFSIVHDPACRPAIINLSKDPLKDVELKKITGFEAVRKRMGLSPAQFYAAPRDPPSSSALPIFDAAHVRNAMARFNQVRFRSSEERSKAKNKIIRAANKFGIKVERFKKLSDSIDSPLESEELNKEKENMPEEKAEEEQKPDEEKPEEKSEEELSNKVKALSEKVDKLVSMMEKKILADEDEEKVEEEKPEEPEKPKEPEDESEVKEELGSLKKELSALKKKIVEDNKPDVKTLATQAKELSVDDANNGMLKFLQARVM